jgi:hypothetical protein
LRLLLDAVDVVFVEFDIEVEGVMVGLGGARVVELEPLATGGGRAEIGTGSRANKLGVDNDPLAVEAL